MLRAHRPPDQHPILKNKLLRTPICFDHLGSR
jgi:hypothetical protein